MTSPLTDVQLTWLFTERLSNSNGTRCGRVLFKNGVTGTQIICGGRSKIVNGRVKLHDTCGEPCSFVCKDTDKFSTEVERVVLYDRLITEAREKAK